MFMGKTFKLQFSKVQINKVLVVYNVFDFVTILLSINKTDK